MRHNQQPRQLAVHLERQRQARMVTSRDQARKIRKRHSCRKGIALGRLPLRWEKPLDQADRAFADTRDDKRKSGLGLNTVQTTRLNPRVEQRSCIVAFG